MTKPVLFTDTDGVEKINVTLLDQPAAPVEALPVGARDYIRALSFYTPELEERACLALHAYKEAERWGQSATGRQRHDAHERIAKDAQRLIQSMEALPYATLVFGYGKEEGGAGEGLVDTVREIKEKAQARLSKWLGNMTSLFPKWSSGSRKSSAIWKMVSVAVLGMYVNSMRHSSVKLDRPWVKRICKSMR